MFLERTITMYVGAVAEIGDGCQLVLFDMPRINGAVPGMILGREAGTVYQNDLIELALTPSGSLFDGKSCKYYRVNDRAWISCAITPDDHEHEPHVEGAAIQRAFQQLKAFQSKL